MTARSKRVVVAWSDEPGSPVSGFGPVYTDKSVAELRADLAAQGWRVGDVITLTSVAELRAESASRGET